MDEEHLEHIGPCGPMFRRELKTAKNHLMPFLIQYLEAVDNQEITLAAAVERFLTETA